MQIYGNSMQTEFRKREVKIKMSKAKKPNCYFCKYCKNYGRTNGYYSENKRSRKKYYCTHPNVAYTFSFVGFGDTTHNRPLTLKTCKKWCPLLVQNLGGEENETD